MRITAKLTIDIGLLEGVTDERIRAAIDHYAHAESMPIHDAHGDVIAIGVAAIAELEESIGEVIAITCDTGDQDVEVTCSLELDP